MLCLYFGLNATCGVRKVIKITILRGESMNEPIKSIKTINPKPTDVIVLRFGDIKVDEMQHCFDHVQSKFPNNTVVALPSPVELEVASKEL